jgi:signal transduction histidine kinase
MVPQPRTRAVSAETEVAHGVIVPGGAPESSQLPLERHVLLVAIATFTSRGQCAHLPGSPPERTRWAAELHKRQLGKSTVKTAAIAVFLRQVTHLRLWKVVNYKALAKTTSSRKRVRQPRAPAPVRVARPQPSIEEMRNVLARELHDSVAQTLSTMLLDLETFRAEQHGRAGVLQQVDQLEVSTRRALADLRELLVELRAQRLGEEDLVKLVKHGLLERQRRGRQVEYELAVGPEWPERIPEHAAKELNRIVQEAIENSVRHSRARKIVVALNFSTSERSAVLTVSDDGRGLPIEDIFSLRPGLGILGMRERASLLGGEVGLETGMDGRGTTVRVTVPLATLFGPDPEA